jgi:hypothetical protein
MSRISAALVRPAAVANDQAKELTQTIQSMSRFLGTPRLLSEEGITADNPIFPELLLSRALQSIRRPSLPLDRARWLRRDVVDHPVDAAHFIDDARRGAAGKFVREGK